jgi:hypothetical protein
MSRVTAHLLVGDGKLSQGITPRWQLFLTEGSQTAWTLHKLDDPAFAPVTWVVCSDDRALEDGLLLVGCYCYNDPGFQQQVESNISAPREKFVDLSKAAHQVDLEMMTDLVRRLTDGRLILTVFEGSLAMEQLGFLDWYKFNIEVCLPAYTRVLDPATKAPIDRGGLDVPDLE